MAAYTPLNTSDGDDICLQARRKARRALFLTIPTSENIDVLDVESSTMLNMVETKLDIEVVDILAARSIVEVEVHDRFRLRLPHITDQHNERCA